MRKRLVVSTAAAFGLLLAVPASAAAATPGDPGIGDPYYPTYGNGGYDAAHYDLRLKYQPATDRLEGTTTIVATATQDLSRFNLDFLLKVDEVRVNGNKATFTRDDLHELVVTPKNTLKKGAPFTVTVRYADTPSTVTTPEGTAWTRTPDGAVVAGEPEGAWWWFPSNDHPADKATFDVSVQVPDGYQAISNGLPTSTVSKFGWTRYDWRSDKPQTTYLATLAVGKFDVTNGVSDNGVPWFNYYSKDLGANAAPAKASVERTPEIIDWLSERFGPYPFNAAGGYVPNVTTTYALESQTRPYYSPSRFSHGSNTSLIVHELAHQWYGDNTSVRNWRDIWLNEGFARYSEWLWSEHENEGTAQELADWTYASRPATDDFWKVRVGDPGPTKVFNAAVYDRGALAIQALRNRVGDESFFRILKGWSDQHRYGNAATGDFLRYAEQVSATALADWYQTWLFTPEKPQAPAAAQAHAAAAPTKPKSWDKIQETTHAHDS